jgi:hypothetical protein
MYDYFAAPSDEAAASVLGQLIGPGKVYPTVETKWIDPVVLMGTLESLLTGVAYRTVIQDPRSGQELSGDDDGEQGVCTVTDGLQSALAEADEERLREVAVPWSQSEEFVGQGDSKFLTGLLIELAALARAARERGDRLYCWTCV